MHFNHFINILVLTVFKTLNYLVISNPNFIFLILFIYANLFFNCFKIFYATSSNVKLLKKSVVVQIQT